MMGHKGKVKKPRQSDGDGEWYGLWLGRCECGWQTQYYSWGAVIGSFFQHLWKESHV